MRHLRAILRIFLLVLWTGMVSLVFFPLRWLSALSPTTVMQIQVGFFGAWAKGVAAIVGMRVRREGCPPSPPFVLVSNHLSYMDIILLATQVNAFFVSKMEVAHWPVLGFLARSVNTIFVDRENRWDVPRVIEEMERVLREGHGVVFFPEGTSSDGKDVLRFKSALFDAPIRMGYPVHAVAIGYQEAKGYPPASTSICWWGDMTFPDHLYRLLQMPWFEATATFGEGVQVREDRREFARATREAVRRGYRPAPAHRSWE